ncbi:SusC/RagA family TonB-linked outer membrane protein [Parafilimonas sp.]|uniref:SusC/RagA family TonB-linked outer membrane protein n=1 Tax=Parafilimonas sp. TaxID=1969739 RepID=UPI0039E537B1
MKLKVKALFSMACFAHSGCGKACLFLFSFGLLSNGLQAKDIKNPFRNRSEYAAVPPSVKYTGKQTFAVDITGKVVDNNGNAVAGATIKVKGKNIGTQADENGTFKLNIAEENAVLIVSSIGYETKEFTVSGTSPLTIVLTSKDTSLNDVVVIGYGTQKKADLTGAVSTVSATDLNEGINQSVSHALQGRASGVTVIQNSGEPGGSVEIRIRGAGTLNDNTPLYVVDGIITSGISDINPADIESMSILKDAASAAIYGSRGANGVVIVTTKKGSKGQKTTFSLNTSQGLQQVWRMPTSLTAAERNTIHTEALTNDGTDTSSTSWDYYTDADNAITRTDWFKEILRTAYTSTQDLAIRGGSDKSNYSLSFGFLDNNGTLLNTYFKRYNLRFNSQHQITKNLEFGENAYLVSSDTRQGDTRSDYSGILSDALFMFRNIPVWEDKANGVYGAPVADINNPVAAIQLINNRTYGTTAGGNAYLQYKLWDIFTIKSDFAYWWSHSKYKSFTDSSSSGGRSFGQNELYENYATGRNWIWNNTITADKTLGKHHISGLIGMSSESDYSEGISATATDFTNQDESLWYFSNASTFSDHITGSASDYTLIGYFARAAYEYDNKYLIAANVRRDGSSKFGPNHRWGTFPSVSGGWRISKENFFKRLTPVVSDLKIRASWGQLGNDKISNYQYYSTLSSVESPTLGGAAYTALASTSIANEDIKWEVTTQTDVGIDLGLLKNSLIITADYYNKKTTDILVQVPLVSSFGINTAPYKNAGSVSNKGFEIGASYRGNAGNFNYEIGGNIAHVTNKLLTFGISGSEDIYVSDYKNTYVGRISEGLPLGHFYVLRALGLFQSQEEINNYVNADGDLIQPDAEPGDVKFEDVDGDGTISSSDKINGGNSFPNFTYSFNFSASYKGFDFSMMWLGSSGNKIFNGLKLGGIFMEGTTYNNSKEILNRWTPENTNTMVPRVTITDPNNNRAYSTLYLEDGSFARMKYLTLGYTFDKKLLGDRISKLRLYLTAQNLITITNYSGFDPEVGADVNSSSNIYGIDRGFYPQSKSFIFGINFNF